MTTMRIWDVALGERDVQLPTVPSGAAGPPVGGSGAPATQPAILAIVNTVSADPGTGQDSTQGYSVGSVIFNNTVGQLRFWTCRDNTAGAAKWFFDGADYANGGTNPNIEITQFGGAPSAQMAEEGNINRQISSAGVSPGSTGNDNVLAVYSLPAGAFDQANRGITITAQGSFVSNANTKDIKIIFNATTAVVGSAVTGGTTIADTGSQTTGTTGTGWSIQANVFKYGAAASNTQIALHQQAQFGSVVGAMLPPSLITATESGAILIAITGNAGTATTDIKWSFLEINAMN